MNNGTRAFLELHNILEPGLMLSYSEIHAHLSALGFTWEESIDAIGRALSNPERFSRWSDEGTLGMFQRDFQQAEPPQWKLLKKAYPEIEEYEKQCSSEKETVRPPSTRYLHVDIDEPEVVKPSKWPNLQQFEEDMTTQRIEVIG